MSCKISWHNTTLMFHNVTITIRLFFSSEIRKDYTQFCPTFRFLCTATGKPPFTESVHVLKTKALIRAFPSEEPDSRVSSGASTCSCCGVCFISSFFSFLPCFFYFAKVMCEWSIQYQRICCHTGLLRSNMAAWCGCVSPT